MLEIENLNFHYGNKQILKDINVTIKTGEILGLIGPNGSGKSTLLRCFNGFLKPSSGQITLNGKNIHKQTRKVDFTVISLSCPRILRWSNISVFMS